MESRVFVFRCTTMSVCRRTSCFLHRQASWQTTDFFFRVLLTPTTNNAWLLEKWRWKIIILETGLCLPTFSLALSCMSLSKRQRDNTTVSMFRIAALLWLLSLSIRVYRYVDRVGSGRSRIGVLVVNECNGVCVSLSFVDFPFERIYDEKTCFFLSSGEIFFGNSNRSINPSINRVMTSWPSAVREKSRDSGKVTRFRHFFH